MWNKTLQLHAPRRFEQNNSVTLEPALELRPQVVDVGSGDDALALFLFLERGCELANPRHDIGTRCQCETRDISMTLR